MAVKLNGSSFLGLAQKLAGSIPCSLSFWCSTDQNGIQQLPFCQSQASADRYLGYFFESNGAGGYGVYRQPGGTGGGLQGFSGGLNATLRHYVLVINSLTSVTLYVTNSTPVTGSTFNITNGDIANHDTITIGGNRIQGAGLSSALNGSIAECAVYNVALTATDVTNIRTGAVKPEDIAGCVACFPLTTASDLTSTNGSYTLTVNGTVVTSSLAHPITRTTTATAVTMSGPTSGTVGTPSTNFTVGANGTISGTVVVTPSDGGAGGTFNPTSVSISSGTPTATFTYTASSSGAKTISVTNNGSLTNPSNITYTASVAAATAVTMTGPTSGAVGSPSTNFTVGANGAITGTVVVTPSDGGGGGSFSPTSVSISSGTPTANFTYTPASTGAKTISVTNNGGLTNPSNITYTASGAAATAVTLTGPTSGFVGSASTNFTVGVNGTISGSVVVTPSDGGGGGSFSPTSVTLTAGTPSGTFTYTPASAGAKTISVTNNAALTNPTNITYTANAIGTITGDPISDEVGNSQAGVTIPKVVFMRISDMTVQLSLTNQVVNGSRLLPISNAALIPGVAYLRILCNADGSKVGAKAYTAA